jgi:hypothetical protein
VIYVSRSVGDSSIKSLPSPVNINEQSLCQLVEIDGLMEFRQNYWVVGGKGLQHIHVQVFISQEVSCRNLSRLLENDQFSRTDLDR